MKQLKEMIISTYTPGEKVIVAMSGGVDSSVAAWAAKEAGCEVEGVTLWLHGDKEQFADAEKVAAHLGINWHLADYREWFRADVVSPYVGTYKRGETPNPCCVCNRVGKTSYLYKEMLAAGATKIATGHYAATAGYNGRKVIVKAASREKDQSYYLCLMDPFHIGFMIYPLSGVESKDDVRKLAAEIGLTVAPKRDSFDACFLNGEDYRVFLFSKIGEGVQGNFTLHGKVIGTHKGTFNYTIGQRKGLDVSHTEPLYVSHIDNKTGEIRLAEKSYLFWRGVRLKDCVFHPSEKTIFRAFAKLRHKMQDAACMVEIQQGQRAVVLFDEGQFAPAPGQVTAVYIGDRLLGGGIVESYF